MTLTEDQARLLHRHCGTWLVAATISDPDYGISSIKGRAGGAAWPDGAHPELPYKNTGVRADRIAGYNTHHDDGARVDVSTVVAVKFTEIKRWASAVPEHIATEIRLQFGLMAKERDRTANWCRCPYKDAAPNAHSEPCRRYHPTDAEDQQHRDINAELDHRQEQFALMALGLAGDAHPQQLDLFEEETA